ncbi:MAG: hypothetical protein EZS28_007649 [Streblomastix strix]|uniref:Signal recognition particle receptor subunit beta n=1 Tax=Streblomastix strix TaxID=222440 RepID=A0A5J4WRV3_9EUKA|nr:MAG: hypothetical protein EZS28_007649 [Streblomastix strix]
MLSWNSTLFDLHIHNYNLKVPVYYVAISIGLLLLLTVILLLFFFKRKVKSIPSFGIVGLNDSGKTALFYLLKEGQKVDTVTSMSENEGVIQLPDNITSNAKQKTPCSIIVTDYPGSLRLRSNFFNSPKFKQFNGILFVIDVSTVQNQAHDIAEFLLMILSNTRIGAQNRKKDEIIPVIIVCNKIDLYQKKSGKKSSSIADDIESILTKELEDIRRRKQKGANTTILKLSDDTSNKKTEAEIDDELVFGENEQEFSFRNLDGKVSFVECSVENELIDDLKSILRSLV